MAESALPFVESIQRSDRQLDPITQQLLFGLGGEGGFIPGAFRAAERVFFDDQGRPLVIPQEIAGLTPDQIRAAQLARQGVGVQQPFIQEAAQQARAPQIQAPCGEATDCWVFCVARGGAAGCHGEVAQPAPARQNGDQARS